MRSLITTLCAGMMLSAAAANAAILINEFQPNPTGTDPSDVDIELLGDAGASFTGWILSVETDPGGSTYQIDRATAVSGSFDPEGLLVVSVPDLENPSFTILVTDTFTGALGDILDDAGDLAGLGIGTVYDAINTPDNVGDEANAIAGLLGGTDLVYSGDEPQLIFRDSLDPSIIYSINDPAGTDAIDQDGNLVAFASFNVDPEATTFGSANPTAVIPEPASAILVLLGASLAGAAAMRSRLG